VISVPFESLHCTVEGNEYDDNIRLVELKRKQLLLQFPETLTDPKQRLKFLAQHRMKIRQDQKRLRRMKAAMNNELRAWSSLQSSFNILTDLFSTFAEAGNLQTELAIVLIFGQNIFRPKEFIVFNCISPTLYDDSGDDVYDKPYLNMKKISKQFYKSIIMSQHFGDFVSKRLRRTSSHLSVMINTPLALDTVSKYSLSLLENFKLPFPDTADSSSTKLNVRHVSKIQPSMFFIDFKSSNSNTEITNGMSQHNINNYFAYKLPISFKGMR